MNLLCRYADEHLAEIAFSLAAWPREGFPDKDLLIPRPPHYRWDLKSGSGQRHNGYSDPALSMDYLTRNTRDSLLAIIDAKLTDRSILTLTWLEQWLASAHDLGRDRDLNPSLPSHVVSRMGEPRGPAEGRPLNEGSAALHHSKHSAAFRQ